MRQSFTDIIRISKRYMEYESQLRLYIQIFPYGSDQLAYGLAPPPLFPEVFVWSPL